MPSYDIGTKIKTENWSLYANWRQGHYIEPFSGGGKTGEFYEYDDYTRLNGVGPGLGWQSQHYNFSFEKQLNNWFWHQEIYLDQNEIKALVVVDPAIKNYSAPSWKEQSLGVLSSFNIQTENANYVFGFQYDAMEIKGSELLVSTSGSELRPIEGAPELLPEGKESIASIFIQGKYRFNDHWLVNIGARYDHKDRYQNENIKDLSPRLALVYSKNEKFNLKLSYASSFVDATFWNRFSSLPSFQGSENLKPERLESLQLTPTFTLLDKNLLISTNIYYNELSDFIFRDNNADILGPNYINAGELKSWGLEFESQYQHDDLNFKAVVSYQQAISSENYGETNGNVHNVPSLTANFISTIAVTPNSDFNLIMRYIGSQTSPIFITGEVSAKEYYVDPALIFSANYQHKMSSALKMKFNLHNVLNHQYEQGGTTVHPYPQQGRSVKISLSYKF
ncbi:TonB-dependent receptor [Pseudoalteromonas sp. NBT06-2]|uniref:TonB-dependent receptor plug domain-containing protein n=1 Tax=Pseudoalteromonas sp. NBT06-2 TaxID=2025950 RepID=UPI001140E6BF|nr:TonB-dependent receptor [Pseudoalteromonas sp. NBT06-2]